VVVPKGRVPELFDVIAEIKQSFRLRVASFGMRATAISTSTCSLRQEMRTKLRAPKRQSGFSYAPSSALEGSISGEHGIGFAKAPYLRIELSADEIALMKRIKAAFDSERDS
jgi:glycolate oxidase